MSKSYPMSKPNVGPGPPPGVGTLVSAANTLTGNTGQGAKSAANAGKGGSSKGSK